MNPKRRLILSTIAALGIGFNIAPIKQSSEPLSRTTPFHELEERLDTLPRIRAYLAGNSTRRRDPEGSLYLPFSQRVVDVDRDYMCGAEDYHALGNIGDCEEEAEFTRRIRSYHHAKGFVMGIECPCCHPGHAVYCEEHSDGTYTYSDRIYLRRGLTRIEDVAAIARPGWNRITRVELDQTSRNGYREIELRRRDRRKF